MLFTCTTVVLSICSLQQSRLLPGVVGVSILDRIFAVRCLGGRPEIMKTHRHLQRLLSACLGWRAREQSQLSLVFTVNKSHTPSCGAKF